MCRLSGSGILAIIAEANLRFYGASVGNDT